MLAFDNCTARVCEYGTGNDQQVLKMFKLEKHSNQSINQHNPQKISDDG